MVKFKKRKTRRVKKRKNKPVKNKSNIFEYSQKECSEIKCKYCMSDMNEINSQIGNILLYNMCKCKGSMKYLCKFCFVRSKDLRVNNRCLECLAIVNNNQQIKSKKIYYKDQRKTTKMICILFIVFMMFVFLLGTSSIYY